MSRDHESTAPDRGRSNPMEERVFVALVRASSEKMFGLTMLLRRHGLTEPQYNVLRILRGAGTGGLPCGQIAERMITRLPDVTRLVDRLDDAGYVRRVRPDNDRRVVLIAITSEGRKLLKKLDTPVLELHREQFSHIKASDLRELARLLEIAIENP